MKGKLKHILFILTMALVSPILEANASNYTEKFNDKYMWIPNTYVNKKESNGTIHYQQLAMITRKSDNQFVYCIEPGVPLNSDETYTGYDTNQAYIANMTQSQWRRIQLLAYYGYGYSDSEVNHNDLKWYSVTQFMIWKTVPNGMDIYFTDSLNGNRISKYTSEMAEMEALLSKHYITPDFGTNSHQMVIGNTLKLTDRNGVISKYAIKNNDYITANKNGNDLYLTAKNVGNTTITLTKKDVKYSHPTIVYVKPGTQNVTQVGSYDPIDTSINIKIVGGKISINKVDNDTGLSTPQGEGTLKGAIYGIYHEDGTYITQIITDEKGCAQSGYLPSLGRFYLQEITPSKGYELDETKYYFDIKTENLYPTILVQEKVIEREYQITKVIASDKTQIMIPEPNVKFGIYDKNKNLVFEKTSDSEGKIIFTLPYGSYTLKQITTPAGFEKIKDFNFEIKESGPTINKVFSNSEITSRIKVIKVDQDGNIINRAGIKFKIKDLSTNKYVCQTVAYPNHVTYCEYETDENGVLITPYPLNSGRYQLEELDQVIEGYTWNKEALEFSIDENSDIKETEDFDAIIELKFINKEVKGKIEIQKVGEKVVIKNGKLTYEEIPLPNVIFGLYDKNNKLINKYTTNSNGFLVIEDLKLGKYILKEIETVSGYVLDKKSYEIELKYKDQYTPVVSEKFTIKNYLEKGKLEFTKTDFSESKPLPNTLMEIYNENDELVFSGRTDSKGKIIIDELPVGKYYMIEKEAPEGYKINEEKMPVEIKVNGEIVKTIMKDEDITGTLEFTKLDFSNDQPLPNTLMEIYNENDELVFSGRTDENGKITIKKLKYGKYYILEKEAPEGYEINPEKIWFEIKEDGEVVKSIMKDYQIIEVPNTDATDYKELVIGGIILIVLGTGVIIYGKKKNK